MKGRSYNSVGAGETPRLGRSKQIEGTGRPAAAQGTSKVKVATDIPKVARPSRLPKAAGQPPKAARPGGAQGA